MHISLKLLKYVSALTNEESPVLQNRASQRCSVNGRAERFARATTQLFARYNGEPAVVQQPRVSYRIFHRIITRALFSPIFQSISLHEQKVKKGARGEQRFKFKFLHFSNILAS